MFYRIYIAHISSRYLVQASSTFHVVQATC